MWDTKKSLMILLTTLIFLASCGIGSAYTETQLSTNTADQYNPSLYEKHITWTDTRNGGTDIYLIEMNSKVQTRVTSSGKADMLNVDYGKIVYQDSRNGNTDIYMYEISTKKETRITTNTSEQVKPSIYGNKMVWEDWRNGYPEIYLQDLTTKTQTRLTQGIPSTSPSIFRDKVIWANEQSKIILYNLTTKKQNIIIEGYESPSGLTISGNRIMWNSYYDSPLTYLYDISTNSFIDLPFDYKSDPAFYGNNIVYSDNRNGNTDIYMVTLGLEIPNADFSASPISGNTPLTVAFTDKSSGSPTEWKWSFGDGSALVTKYNPTYTYTKPGTYTVKETVSNAAGKDTEIKTNYITVKNPTASAPVAAFTASPTSGSSPLKVQFTDQSSNGPTSWKWDFGDKSSSTDRNPVHTYSTAGTYTAKLTASNTAGSSTVTKTSYIKVNAVPLPSTNVYISGLRLGASGETPNQEYVQITNKGTTEVKMNGWKITDSGAKHTYYFPSSDILKSKSTVTLYTGTGTNSAAKLFWGRSSHVWNNEGDTAYLYNAQGALVSKLTK